MSGDVPGLDGSVFVRCRAPSHFEPGVPTRHATCSGRRPISVASPVGQDPIDRGRWRGQLGVLTRLMVLVRPPRQLELDEAERWLRQRADFGRRRRGSAVYRAQSSGERIVAWSQH